MGSASSSSGRITIKLIQLAVHQVLAITVLWILEVFIVFLIHVRIRCWECRIDVLWSGLVLGSFTLFDMVEICLLERAILIQGSTHKVGRVGEIHCLIPWVYGYVVLARLAFGLWTYHHRQFRTSGTG